jgi:hypothetical protein
MQVCDQSPTILVVTANNCRIGSEMRALEGSTSPDMGVEDRIKQAEGLLVRNA